MSKQPEINNKEEQVNKYQQGSGSKYHEEHASNIPDYGANTVDPNVNMQSNTREKHQGTES